MFTGIVEERGRVRSVTHHDGGARIVIDAQTVLDDAILGASIAVNGCCLTVTELAEGWWAADAVSETLERTTIGALRPGDAVNLERPVRLADRLGGHLVQGHVDAVAAVVAREDAPDGSARVRLGASPEVLRYVVEKGSVALDGVSLTVAAVDAAGFEIALVPHTLAVTTFGERHVGDACNLEIDVVAKYVERLLPGGRWVGAEAGAPDGAPGDGS